MKKTSFDSWISPESLKIISNTGEYPDQSDEELIKKPIASQSVVLKIIYHLENHFKYRKIHISPIIYRIHKCYFDFQANTIEWVIIDFSILLTRLTLQKAMLPFSFSFMLNNDQNNALSSTNKIYLKCISDNLTIVLKQFLPICLQGKRRFKAISQSIACQGVHVKI